MQPLPCLGNVGGEAARDESADAIPADLDTDTKQDERRQTHDHASARRPQFTEDTFGIAIAQIDAHGDEKDTNRVCQRCEE